MQKYKDIKLSSFNETKGIVTGSICSNSSDFDEEILNNMYINLNCSFNKHNIPEITSNLNDLVLLYEKYSFINTKGLLQYQIIPIIVEFVVSIHNRMILELSLKALTYISHSYDSKIISLISSPEFLDQIHRFIEMNDESISIWAINILLNISTTSCDYSNSIMSLIGIDYIESYLIDTGFNISCKALMIQLVLCFCSFVLESESTERIISMMKNLLLSEHIDSGLKDECIKCITLMYQNNNHILNTFLSFDLFNIFITLIPILSKESAKVMFGLLSEAQFQGFISISLPMETLISNASNPDPHIFLPAFYFLWNLFKDENVGDLYLEDFCLKGGFDAVTNAMINLTGNTNEDVIKVFCAVVSIVSSQDLLMISHHQIMNVFFDTFDDEYPVFTKIMMIGCLGKLIDQEIISGDNNLIISISENGIYNTLKNWTNDDNETVSHCSSLLIERISSPILKQ